jgi:hypothetical protein
MKPSEAAQNPDLETKLLRAASEGNTQTCLELIAKGANLATNNYEAIRFAAANHWEACANAMEETIPESTNREEKRSRQLENAIWAQNETLAETMLAANPPAINANHLRAAGLRASDRLLGRLLAKTPKATLKGFLEKKTSETQNATSRITIFTLYQQALVEKAARARNQEPVIEP